ncbi:MAG: class I SAM-dependent methyltransferase [Methylibium sp.]|uniref:SAM-dependent methyltransferase n=1 Tax=Methylibium sp. TaxID=2067992 RepID=UPI0017B997DF|nr:cyclopropane-fatty-acyl-phospholipid synthase family protein [Methylibium sp.]MBA3597446.1 class I SAM-dependent methyltransferase [Methylibium sp.]
MARSTAAVVKWVEQGFVPDRVVRLGIRRLLGERLREIGAGDAARAAEAAQTFADSLRAAPLALLPQTANEQHYEVPAAFFAQVLGRHRKYSGCWWPEGVNTLDEAEAAALAMTCVRAELTDGQHILELGCGWGSLTLWMAERFPGARITAVSNSHSQREHIEAEAAQRGLGNVRVITCDMNQFDTDERFDRVVSVEMFEHLRNWPEAFRRVSGWLAPQGRFFMHVFAHRSTPYAFEERDASDWMSRHFFSGGMMPSDDLPLQFQQHLGLVRRWRWDGTHYQRTAQAWLANMDARRAAVWPVLEQTYGRAGASVWWMRWRLFFMSCAELFGYDGGQQWWVSHYLFERRS